MPLAGHGDHIKGNDITATGTQQTQEHVDLAALAKRTDGFSGAEVASVCREAALAAMEEDPEHVMMVCRRHFEVRNKTRTHFFSLFLYDAEI